jgi:indole-3-glycerol phosphate synthase
VQSLERLISASRRALEERRERRSLTDLEHEATALPAIRPFTEAVVGEEIAFVLRLDGAQPVLGDADADECLAGLVVATGGADEPALARLRDVAAASTLPLLEEGVVIDPYQVYEARLAGADGLVLIAAAFEDADRDFVAVADSAYELGLDVIVEVSEEEEIERVLELLDPDSFLIRNFDRSGRVDFERTFSLLEEVPAGKVVLSDGGVEARDQVIALERAGVDAAVLDPWVLAGGLKAALDVLCGDAR